jgi:hypothetical protein
MLAWAIFGGVDVAFLRRLARELAREPDLKAA